MVMLTILKYLDSNRNFHTPTQSSWKQNVCFRRTHQGTTKEKNYTLLIGQNQSCSIIAKRNMENGSNTSKVRWMHLKM